MEFTWVTPALTYQHVNAPQLGRAVIRVTMHVHPRQGIRLNAHRAKRKANEFKSPVILAAAGTRVNDVA